MYKNVGLKTLMEARSLTLADGPKTMARMVDALSGVPGAAVATPHPARNDGGDSELSSARTAVIKAVLTKSFLPFCKGKARDTCNLGHRLEKPILKRWVEVVLGREMLYGPPSDYNGIDIKAAYSVGLAAKRGVPYAKDSVDFVLAVGDEQGDKNDVVAWGFEAKGRVTFRTAASEEQDLLELQRNSHLCVQDVDLYNHVADLGERFQVLQHAYVYM